MQRTLVLRFTAAAAVLAIGLTSCGTADSTASSSPPAVTAEMSMGSMTAADAAADHNNADLMFAQMMTVHHQGAIAMADLAPERATSDQVKELAATIKAEQAPEIDQMTGWLTDWGMAMSSNTTGMGGMGGMGSTDPSASSAMPGMMTDAQMTELAAASGTDFDRLFLTMMIEHHQGAITMAQTEVADGLYPDAIALAHSIEVSQTAQITTMQDLLQTI